MSECVEEVRSKCIIRKNQTNEINETDEINEKGDKFERRRFFSSIS